MAFNVMDYIPQWGQAMGNTQDVSGMPTDDAMAQLQLKRKIAQAELLRNQQAPEGQMVSGRYVAPSWTQNLANVAGKLIGARQEREAMKDYGDYQTAQKQKRQTEASKLAKALSPKAITEEGAYDIQIPNGKTPQTENLGGMQPYESGMKNISVPMTTTTGYRNPNPSEVLSAVSDYSTALGQPEIAEKLMLGQATQMLAPKEYDWKTIGNMAFQVDKSGKATGQVVRNPKPESDEDPTSWKEWTRAKETGYKGSYEDWKRLATSWINPYQAANLGIEREKLKLKEAEDNPLGLPKPSAQPKTSPLNIAQPKTQSFKIDGMGSVNGTYDAKVGKYYVMQGNKKFWIED